MTRLNAKNSFGLLNLKNDKNTWINVICGILLIVLIVLLIICLVKGKDSFGDTNKDPIKVFVRERCPFVERAKKLHQKNNNRIKGIPIEYIDINDPAAKAYGITGTPTYFYQGNKVTGFHDDENELYKKLTGGNNSKKSTTKNHLMVGSTFCPYCIQAKALLDKNGVKYDFIDSNSQFGKDKMLEVKATGVPVFITIDGEVIIGFDKEKLSQLK